MTKELGAADLLIMKKQSMTGRKFTLNQISKDLKIPSPTLHHYFSASFGIPEERAKRMAEYFGFKNEAEFRAYLKKIWKDNENG